MDSTPTGSILDRDSGHGPVDRTRYSIAWRS